MQLLPTGAELHKPAFVFLINLRSATSFPHCCRYEEARQALREAGLAALDAADAAGGLTPLMLACAGGHGRLVKLLLRKGACIDAQDSQGCTALHLAARQGHKAVARHLLEAGADTSRRDAAGMSGADVIAAWAAQQQDQKPQPQQDEDA